MRFIWLSISRACITWIASEESGDPARTSYWLALVDQFCFGVGLLLEFFYVWLGMYFSGYESTSCLSKISHFLENIALRCKSAGAPQDSPA